MDLTVFKKLTKNDIVLFASDLWEAMSYYCDSSTNKSFVKNVYNFANAILDIDAKILDINHSNRNLMNLDERNVDDLLRKHLYLFSSVRDTANSEDEDGNNNYTSTVSLYSHKRDEDNYVYRGKIYIIPELDKCMEFEIGVYDSKIDFIMSGHEVRNADEITALITFGSDGFPKNINGILDQEIHYLLIYSLIILLKATELVLMKVNMDESDTKYNTGITLINELIWSSLDKLISDEYLISNNANKLTLDKYKNVDFTNELSEENIKYNRLLDIAMEIANNIRCMKIINKDQVGSIRVTNRLIDGLVDLFRTLYGDDLYQATTCKGDYRGVTFISAEKTNKDDPDDKCTFPMIGLLCEDGYVITYDYDIIDYDDIKESFGDVYKYMVGEIGKFGIDENTIESCMDIVNAREDNDFIGDYDYTYPSDTEEEIIETENDEEDDTPPYIKDISSKDDSSSDIGQGDGKNVAVLDREDNKISFNEFIKNLSHGDAEISDHPNDDVTDGMNVKIPLKDIVDKCIDNSTLIPKTNPNDKKITFSNLLEYEENLIQYMQVYVEDLCVQLGLGTDGIKEICDTLKDLSMSGIHHYYSPELVGSFSFMHELFSQDTVYSFIITISTKNSILDSILVYYDDEIGEYTCVRIGDRFTRSTSSFSARGFMNNCKINTKNMLNLNLTSIAGPLNISLEPVLKYLGIKEENITNTIQDHQIYDICSWCISLVYKIFMRKYIEYMQCYGKYNNPWYDEYRDILDTYDFSTVLNYMEEYVDENIIEEKDIDNMISTLNAANNITKSNEEIQLIDLSKSDKYIEFNLFNGVSTVADKDKGEMNIYKNKESKYLVDPCRRFCTDISYINKNDIFPNYRRLLAIDSLGKTSNDTFNNDLLKICKFLKVYAKNKSTK